MAVKTPIEEETGPYEEVVKTGVLDWIGICFGFAWFMRRTIVGTVLSACLLYGIYKVWMIPPETFDKGASALVLKETFSDTPTANIGFAPQTQESFSKDSDKPKVRRFEDIELPEAEEIVPYDPLFETGSVDELVGKILELRDRWVGKDEAVVFLINQRRAKLARRLMEFEISEERQIFSLSEYIESVIVMDMVASKEKMKTPEVRVAIEEVVSKYLRHSYPTIRAKSSLANVSIPLHDFSRDQGNESLDEFAARFDLCGDQIFEDPVAAARLGSMLLWLRKICDWDGVELPYCVTVLNKMDDSQDPKIRSMGSTLRERVFFEHLEPNDLVDRLGQGDKEVRPVIQEFFQGIDTNPDVRLAVYQVAVSVIERIKWLEQEEDYESLVNWLRKISKKVSSESKKAEILMAIKKLEALPWGAKPDVPDSNPTSQ